MLTIILVIIGVFVVLSIMSGGGWILRALGSVASLFFSGISSCLGCIFQIFFWGLIISIAVAMIL